MLELNKLYNCDCMEGMKLIPDKSVDMILCDLPYGTTACKWDTIIPFRPLWEQYERIIKDNGAIVLFGSQPFTSSLVMSNLKLFRCEWIWEKETAANYGLAKKQPLKIHESIIVFSKNPSIYNPQGLIPYNKMGRKRGKTAEHTRVESQSWTTKNFQTHTNYPKTILKFSKKDDKGIHPTQKPVALFEYLIRTYTNEGETVLDNCMGSGTTAIAAQNTNRRFIGFELDKGYFSKAQERLEAVKAQVKMF